MGDVALTIACLGVGGAVYVLLRFPSWWAEHRRELDEAKQARDGKMGA